MVRIMSMACWGVRSLPSRERGLKCHQVVSGPTVARSLPSRERGLKYVEHTKKPLASMSLPSRERGLKSGPSSRNLRQKNVAPFTGAWIEMLPARRLARPDTSLPSRERGLKFRVRCVPVLLERSLPSRERGLKYQNRKNERKAIVVAPFTGAWIEMLSAVLETSVPASRSLHGSVD